MKKWALVLIFCLACASAEAKETPLSATVSKLDGGTQVKRGGGTWEMAEAGMQLGPMDEILTWEGEAEVLLDKGGKIGKLKISPYTRLRINTLKLDPETGDQTTLLELAIGKVLVHASKLKGKSTFRVNTPTSSAGVRGTVFEITVEPRS